MLMILKVWNLINQKTKVMEKEVIELIEKLQSEISKQSSLIGMYKQLVEKQDKLIKSLTTPTDTETNYLLQGKNGERLRESIEQTKDKATFLKADLTIGGIYQILGQFGEEHEPIKKKFREYCETLTKNQK
jgi:hypothetical protein